MQQRHKVTITDIATAAGVSKTTVSRYINGRADLLSESARTRIKKAIEQSDYIPSAAARNLKEHTTRQIGIVLADITTPFSASLVAGAGETLRQAGYTALSCDAANSPQTEESVTELLLQAQVDGLIVNTVSADNPKLVRLARAGIPVVLCDRYVNDCPADIVVNEHCDSTLELMSHLHGQGFTQVAFLTEPYENNSPRYIRMDAFLDADRRLFGASNPESDIHIVDISDPRSTQKAVASLYSRARSAGTPIAVFASSMPVLIDAHRAIGQLGESAKHLLALCGPDEWGWAQHLGWDWASELSGGVTTLRCDPRSMGREAARLLLRRLADPQAKLRETVIPMELQARASTLLRA